MKKRPQSREDVPWSKRQEIPAPQVLDAADQYEKACKLLAEQPPGSGVLLPLTNTAAMAVELYLKCLFAELMHVEDELMPEVSRVYAAPAITSGQGHGLVALLNVMPPDVRRALINAFDAESGHAGTRISRVCSPSLKARSWRLVILASTASTSLAATSIASWDSLISSVVSRGAFNRRTGWSGSEAA
jgi:hypothetical protein